MNILLITYRRLEHVAKIIDSLSHENVKFYVYSNAWNDKDSEQDVKIVRSVIRDKISEGKVYKVFWNKVYLPVEHSIPFAVDWFFNQVDCGLVLEDDCVVNEGAYQIISMLFSSIQNKDLKHINLHNKIDFGFLNIEDRRLDTVKLVSVWGWISNSYTWNTANCDINVNLSNYLKSFDGSGISRFHALIYFFLYLLNKYNLIKSWDFIYAARIICSGAEVVQVYPSLITSKGLDKYSTNHKFNHELNIDPSKVPFGFEYDSYLLKNLYSKMLFKINFRRIKNLFSRI
ncbi:hypothetical protein N8714_01290 [Rhodobacteraceae bacterium]|nr:hypothetical protein [Paracoccaceae bacterium]